MRGWAGYFPSKLSTTGAEYTERSMADKVIGSGDEAAVAIEDLERRQAVVFGTVDEKLAVLGEQLIAFDERLAHLERPTTGTDYMLEN